MRDHLARAGAVLQPSSMARPFRVIILRRSVCAPRLAGHFSHQTIHHPVLPFAVLNYGYWQRVFGGDSSVVGKTISLNGVLFTIVGVPESRFISLTPGNIYDIWIPLSVELR